MDKVQLKKLGVEWTALNEKYDGYIQELIDSPAPALSPKKLKELEALQDELFNLEVELFGVLRGE